MKFTKWLDKKFENEELEVKMVSPEDQLDKLYWHRTLKCSGLEFPDGYYYVTACLKEDDGFVFGLFPLETSEKSDWITYRSNNLNWLEKTEIIETDKYDDIISTFNKATEALQKKIEK